MPRIRIAEVYCLVVPRSTTEALLATYKGSRFLADNNYRDQPSTSRKGNDSRLHNVEHVPPSAKSGPTFSSCVPRFPSPIYLLMLAPPAPPNAGGPYASQ